MSKGKNVIVIPYSSVTRFETNSHCFHGPWFLQLEWPCLEHALPLCYADRSSFECLQTNRRLLAQWGSIYARITNGCNGVIPLLTVLGQNSFFNSIAFECQSHLWTFDSSLAKNIAPYFLIWRLIDEGWWDDKEEFRLISSSKCPSTQEGPEHSYLRVSIYKAYVHDQNLSEESWNQNWSVCHWGNIRFLMGQLFWS